MYIFKIFFTFFLISVPRIGYRVEYNTYLHTVIKTSTDTNNLAAFIVKYIPVFSILTKSCIMKIFRLPKGSCKYIMAWHNFMLYYVNGNTLKVF